MEAQEYAITAAALKKSYQKTSVLKGVDFRVRKGSIFSLLGSNGAGKTTTIKILTTLMEADGGEVRVEGYEIGDAEHIRPRISLTGQFAAVDEALTGRENLLLMARLNHVPDPAAKADRLLEDFGLSEFAGRRVCSYSGGMKRRLDLAMCLAGSPSIIFLDEPTTGLDPQSRHAMWKIIRDLKQSGVTIFLTTQYLEEAEQLADQIAILHKGLIIAEGTAEELKKSLPRERLAFSFADSASYEKALSVLAGFRLAASAKEKKVSVYTDGTADTIAKLFADFYTREVKIESFSQIRPTLEEVFLSLIGETEGEENE
jgi:ABC-2 type transport system ATP-binding protein